MCAICGLAVAVRMGITVHAVGYDRARLHGIALGIADHRVKVA